MFSGAIFRGNQELSAQNSRLTLMEMAGTLQKAALNSYPSERPDVKNMTQSVGDAFGRALVPGRSSSFASRLHNLAWLGGMVVSVWCGVSSAAVHTIDLGRDRTWAVFRIAGDGTVDFLFTGPAVGTSGSDRYRSVMSFDLRSLPDTEKVVRASLELSPQNVNIRGTESIGSVRHMDASVPPRVANRPVDPFRFTPANIAAAPFVADLNLGLNGSYDVTAAVALDHRIGRIDSPLGLLENASRFSSIAQVTYGTGGGVPAPRLVVETALPEAVTYSLEGLGGDRYRATYLFRNEISLPLALIDIEFDPASYREDSLTVLVSPGAPPNWDAFVLAAGIEVPAAVSFAATDVGLSAGEVANGFQVEFDFIGAGSPGRQRYTVFDADTFTPQYSGFTAPVPWPASIWLVLGGLPLVAGRAMNSKQVALKRAPLPPVRARSH